VLAGLRLPPEPAYEPSWLPDIEQPYNNVVAPVRAQAEQPMPASSNGHQPDASYPAEWLTEAELGPRPGLGGEGFINEPTEG
jgi:hypothetical protein